MSTRLVVVGLPLWSTQQWLLGLFFVASGLLAWWQLAPTPEETPSPVERPRLPDYVVTRFTAVETDATGKPSRRLIAEALRQYVEEDVAELDQPRMTLYTETGAPWQARADTGLVLPGGKEVRLSGAVELRRDGDAHNRATRMSTESIRIWHERGFAETDQPVQVNSEADWLTAAGMRLWYDTPTHAQFDGRARIFIAPEQVDES